MRRLMSIVAVAALLAGCTADPYPLHGGPPGASGTSPAKVGTPATMVVIWIDIRPGDRIDFLGAEPAGSLEGTSVRFSLSRPVLHADGSHVIGEKLETLEGAEVSAPSGSTGSDNTVGIVAELTAQRPGRYELTSIRLRYRLNGGDEQVREGIDDTWTVCADDPAPATCSSD